MDNLGRLAWICELCERNAKGLCRDCPRPLATKRAIRCDECRMTRARQLRNKNANKSYWRRRDRVLARKRDYQRQPEVQARTHARQARYRAEHPVERDGLLRAYHRAWMRQRRKDHAWRERINARRREIARMKRAGTWKAVA